jgi:predicted phage terminase large subunit-like protein
MNREDIALLEQLAALEAREDFWAFRQYINGQSIKLGWWQREVSNVLTAFYEELMAGNRPKYIIEAPPQHGKSVQIVDFLAWLAGKCPDKRTIYTSFSERLGVRANLRMQRILDSDKYKRVFPDTKLNQSGALSAGSQYLRNRDILEYVGHEGYFRNTTVRGSITGEGLDLGVIDDPLKGREAAGSETVRDATWDWFTDDFFSRFSEDAGLLTILTRWHIDDPVGRLLALDSSVKVFKYPAIAEGKRTAADVKNRSDGEPLFQEHKSLEFLLERKKIMIAANWSALYQQNPVVQGGEIIQGAWFKRYSVLPRIQWRKIYVDTAQKTAERNDYSVFEVWGKGESGGAYLIDLLRGKWEAPELRKKARDFWAKHKALDAVDGLGRLRSMVIEDKASGTGLIQDLRSSVSPSGKVQLIPVEPVERTKDKYTEVGDALPYIESGYVYIPEEAPWVSDFVKEAEEFTADDTHSHDDQIDPMCDAIDEICGGSGKIDIWKGIL